jgi:hypothetical protein
VLLTLTTDPAVIVTQRVVFGVRMQKCLHVLVADGDRVKIADLWGRSQHNCLPSRQLLALTVEQQFVPLQSLLEGRAHEGISRTRVDQDLEVNVEERKVYDEWKDDEAESAVSKVLVKVRLTTCQ